MRDPRLRFGGKSFEKNDLKYSVCGGVESVLLNIRTKSILFRKSQKTAASP
jgi:hypothetical protein